MAWFTSAYKALLHGTPNWDTQLRADMGLIETNLAQANFAPGYGGDTGATPGTGAGLDGFAARNGAQVTYNGRVVFGPSAVAGGGVITNVSSYGNCSVTQSLGYGWFKPISGTPRPLILIPLDGSSFGIRVVRDTGLVAFNTLGNPAQSDELHFVINAILA